jgi:hypothetical protein
MPNFDISSVEVRTSEAGEKAGRGVFALKDIPANSYVGLETATYNVDFPPLTYALILDMHRESAAEAAMDVLFYYIDGYGFTSRYLVSGNATYGNHRSFTF